MKSLKLNSLSTSKLEKKELSKIVGGTVCGCACRSNSNDANGYANHDGGLNSPGDQAKMNHYLDSPVVIGHKLS